MSKKSRKGNDVADMIISNKRNANLFLDLIGDLEDDDVKVVVKSINGVTRVCIHQINSGLFATKSKNASATSGSNPEEVYTKWMKDRYRDACLGMCGLFFHFEETVRNLSMMSMMTMLKAEAKAKKGADKFPVQLFFQIIDSIISAEPSDVNPITVNFIESFQENISKYDDARFYTMKALQNAVAKIKIRPVSMEKMFHLMKNLNMPSTKEDVPLNTFLINFDENDKLKFSCLKEQKKIFSTLWVDFLALELSPELFMNVMEILHVKVMPFMTNPLVLSDFLILSCSLENSVSVLALNGLFILMTSYNLDYPDFYKKLYSFLKPSTFCTPYTSQFLGLLDCFLQSTHLSAALVAAFVKKLARISTTLALPQLLTVVTLIINLIIRHPNCQILIHNPRLTNVSDVDPFDEEEEDPLNTKALQSSLWEIKALQSNMCHVIADLSKKISGDLPINELPYDANITHTKLMDKVRKLRFRKAPEKDNPIMDNPDGWDFSA